MKIRLARAEAQKKIREFFEKLDFKAEEIKKIRRLAMKFNIKLGNYRKLFCKKCFSQLKGKTRIKNKSKTIICDKCGFMNRRIIKRVGFI